MYCVNRDKGCRIQQSQEQLKYHQSQCEFVCTSCPFCSKIFLKINKKIHLKICPETNIECPNCKTSIKRKDLKSHEEKSCSYKIEIQCKGCKNKIRMINYKDHQKICPELIINCECGESFKRKDKDNHPLLKCVGKMYKEDNSYIKSETEKLKRYVSILKRKSGNLQTFLDSKCELCEEVMCEIYKKDCYGCKKYFCKNCHRKIFKNCKKCNTKFCEACCLTFLEFEFCYSCKPNSFKQKLHKLKALNKLSE